MGLQSLLGWGYVETDGAECRGQDPGPSLLKILLVRHVWMDGGARCIPVTWRGGNPTKVLVVIIASISESGQISAEGASLVVILLAPVAVPQSRTSFFALRLGECLQVKRRR